MKLSDSDYIRGLKNQHMPFAKTSEIKEKNERIDKIANNYDVVRSHLNEFIRAYDIDNKGNEPRIRVGPTLDEAYDNARAYLATLEESDNG